MIFDEELDEVLYLIIRNKGKNSLEIAKFIKNIPIDYLNDINNIIHNSNIGDNKKIAYKKLDDWYYLCQFKKDSNEKELFIGQYLNNEVNPIFFVSLIAFNKEKLKNLKVSSIRNLGSGGFSSYKKNYFIKYYLKKFSGEYLVSGEAMIPGMTYGSKYSNIINVSEIPNDLNINELDIIIKKKINIKKRKRNNY